TVRQVRDDLSAIYGPVPLGSVAELLRALERIGGLVPGREGPPVTPPQNRPPSRLRRWQYDERVPRSERRSMATVAADRPHPEEKAAAGKRPLVKRHHWIVRLTHWANTVLLFGMIASGLQIYGAFTHFGARGHRYLPNPVD